MNSRGTKEAETIEISKGLCRDGKGKKRFKEKYPDF